MKELAKMLKDPNVPESVKTTVQSMNNDGMQLLNDYYDKNSNFYQHAHPELIANEFYADPNKLKNYIITLPMKHLKEFFHHLLF
ncbi:hypothetical protein ACWEYB_07465 [Staphylococcus xylosus]|uniref:hypothetical protein n=1 Tax=Staphylococcus gallinarum TaxID=1293 RepID=UPI003F57C3C9